MSKVTVGFSAGRDCKWAVYHLNALGLIQSQEAVTTMQWGIITATQWPLTRAKQFPALSDGKQRIKQITNKNPSTQIGKLNNGIKGKQGISASGSMASFLQISTSFLPIPCQSNYGHGITAHKSRERVPPPSWPTARYKACSLITFLVQDSYYSPVFTQTINTPMHPEW